MTVGMGAAAGPALSLPLPPHAASNAMEVSTIAGNVICFIRSPVNASLFSLAAMRQRRGIVENSRSARSPSIEVQFERESGCATVSTLPGEPLQAKEECP